ncbi:MAG: 50S ribosomal protein L24 [Clostridia bacterium]|nr:50S ribosomal protein L24 [Clostridia bacterium]
MADKLHVKKDDTVVVISGDDKGKKGKVLTVSPKERKVIVDGVNIVTKHAKPRRQGEAGGIMKVEGAIYADKVQLYCAKCDKATRAAHKTVDGKKVRVCVKCGAEL